MTISRPLKTTLLLGLTMPMSLFILGVYNGVMQTLYRAGVLQQHDVAGINYYQGLTMHGVINAIVLTTFFAVIFGHYTIVHYLRKEPPKWSYITSIVFMITGSVIALVVMVLGKASVLYTFYAPLQAAPLFYIGTAMLIIGSWIAFAGWVPLWFEWKRENPLSKMPIAILGTFVNFTMWFMASIPVIYELLALLTPWAMGIREKINVPETRTLFWMFGHPLVYFWILPAYIGYYTMLPKIAGGKLYSGNAARLAFLLFLILSTPVGVHHQFSEGGISPSIKLWVSILTFGVSLPSFMTAFTVGASLEYAGKKRGAKGVFQWMARLPWFRKDNYLFGYFICGLILFIFGGLSGIVNGSYTLNQLVHNTGWVPGHFHLTVAGPSILFILGLTLYMFNHVSGKPLKHRATATIIPYLWTIGVAMLAHGLMAGGLMGEPRRTNMGLTYTNPESHLFNSAWVPSSTMTMLGGIIMGTAALLYFVIFFRMAFSRPTTTPKIEMIESEELHIEKPIPLLLNMRPWIILAIILVASTYYPSFKEVFKYSKPVDNRFDMENPANLNRNNE
ncbi:cbb3-type cytochrome c oxidase subunit I [Sphingobacterium chuzhouense]|uniref:Cbb3-type cytochrome c oxidase subunit I n=1 Tax=Sphingobacterium chuzhouense TaxID=1742264 RepID=A0ABR7XU47_9SPHI|nr:cbb3-type cytochrome c oxidase subunit I [Sphingobacterium chuzhouense]MBD1422297.1 cbb3-type cytochrome c oxidase subunit I [Sphingobacterium chuzhouense]